MKRSSTHRTRRSRKSRANKRRHRGGQTTNTMGAPALVASALNILRTASVTNLQFFMTNGQGIPMSLSPQQQQQVSSYMSSQQRNSMNSSVSQEVQRVVSGMSPAQISQIPYMSSGVPGANITQILTLLSMYIYNLPTFNSIGLTFPPQYDALLSTSTTGATTGPGMGSASSPASASTSQTSAVVAYSLNKLKTESVTNLNYFMTNGGGNPTNMTAQQQQQIAPIMSSPNTQAILNGIPQEVQRVVNAMSPTEKSQIPYSQTGVTKPDITVPLIQLARFSYLAPMYRSVGVTFPAQFNTLA